MIKFLLTLLLATSTTFVVLPVSALPDLDDEDVSDTVDISSFMVGSDGDVGTLFYIVDRTTNNCFATIRQSAQASGITAIDCKSLASIEMIDNYIKNGQPE